MTADPSRRIFLVTHAGRPDAQRLAAGVASRLLAAGVGVCAPAEELVDTPLADVPGVQAAARVDPSRPRTSPAAGCELVCVLGGDGTILRGAELSRGSGVPLLGVNLGHVGFLAEAEREDLDATVERIVSRDYHVEERMALEVRAVEDGRPVFTSWALNEVTVEKAHASACSSSRSRSTVAPCRPGGATASSWRRPPGPRPTPSRRVGRWSGPTSRRSSSCRSAPTRCSRAPWWSAPSPGSSSRCSRTRRLRCVWCDGRRAVELPPGARIEVQRSSQPVRLARLSTGGFTDRLVEKFDLPVQGWRGAARRCWPRPPKASGTRRGSGWTAS